MNQLLLYPMAFYMFYTFILAVFNFRVRVRVVKSREIPLHFFKAYQGENLPESVQVMGRHYDNQFQVPLLFLISCLAVMQAEANSLLLTLLAWGFVISRIIHSLIHLGSNSIRPRMLAYTTGWLILLAMWVVLLLEIRSL